MKPAVVIGLFATVLIAFLAVVLLSDKIQLHRLVSLEKSPEALKERARTIVHKLGYTDPPGDSTYGLGVDSETLNYVFPKKPSLIGRLAGSQPATIYFWYRQSPRYLIPRTQNASRARISDPPESVPAMATVFLDPMGRLLEFHSVPPQVEPPQPDVKQPFICRQIVIR